MSNDDADKDDERSFSTPVGPIDDDDDAYDGDLPYVDDEAALRVQGPLGIGAPTYCRSPGASPQAESRRPRGGVLAGDEAFGQGT